MSPIPSPPIRLAIHGAAGRMGLRIAALAKDDLRFRIVAAIDAPDDRRTGGDIGELAGIGRAGVQLAAHCDADFDVMIDFSAPAGTFGAIETCVSRGRSLVIGTTGLAAEHHAQIDAAAKRIAVVQSPNMSVGVNVMLRAARDLAAALGEAYDIEIVEAHHRFKADAPSGTALALLDVVRAARPDLSVVHGREGRPGPRTANEIGMHALRVGDTVGEHTVYFGGLGETLSLRHDAHTRDTFAAGALRAAAWVALRQPGRYTMQHVLFDT